MIRAVTVKVTQINRLKREIETVDAIIIGSVRMICFLSTFRTIKRIIFQNCIFSNSVTGFIAADRATYPICF